MARDDVMLDAGVETMVHDQRFAVAHDFPVVFTQAMFDPANPALIDALARREADKRHKVVVFADGGLAKARPNLFADVTAYANAHAGRMELVGDLVVTPAGEAVKNDLVLLDRYQRILFDRHIDRHSYVLAIGGGAHLDAVGFVAATCHRGVRIVRAPSTTLAQNDAGVGVKNGVNLFGAKNFMGSFAPPWAVINDIDLLDTLEDRDRRAGIAEAVKVALIRDGKFYDWLEENAEALARFDRAAMAYQIRRCAELHMAQIGGGGDPFESGSARPLDFGHWSAHRLEGLTRHAVRHGEAVAIGIALDTRYSALAGLLSEADAERVCSTLERIGFTLWDDKLAARDDDGRLCILKGLADFQEHLGGELTVTLLSSLGVGHDVHAMDTAKVEEAVAWLAARREATT